MKRVILAALLCAALPAAANAETFTFTTASKPIGNLTVPAATAGGKPSGAAVFSITTDATFASGKKLTSTGQCAQWILPAGDQFGSNTVCKYSDASGELYIARTTCENPGPNSDCWGKLVARAAPSRARPAPTPSTTPKAAPATGFWTD